MASTRYLIYHQIGPEKHGSNWNTAGELERTPGIQTFDGVYESVYWHRDLIRPGAILFVTGGYLGEDNGWDTGRQGPIERYCTKEQLLELVADCGAHLGWHTWTHPRLTIVGDDQLERELTPPDWIPTEFFAYPYGAWNRHVVGAVHDMGYRAAFVVGRRGNNQFTLPRSHA